MDAAQFEALVQRLIADPHDAEALARAHDAGQSDPHTYASLLERVGAGASDMPTAAHWFNEAATVWQSIGEPAHYQRLVLAAAERDATNSSVVERAAQMYQEHQDAPGMAHLYERVVAETRQVLGDETDPQEVQQLRELLTRSHEQLAYVYAEGALQDPDAAARHWMGLLELEPQHVMAIYHARELFKAQGRWHEALPLFDRELALVDDPERRLALLQDEAEVRKQAGDRRGATEALRKICEIRPDDVGAKYAFATSITERIEQGQPVTAGERTEAAQALVGLAEMYDGEHGFMYSLAALKAEPGHDRAMQLADYHGQALGRAGELGDAYGAYLLANPSGYMAEAVVQQLAKLGLPVPGRSAPPPPSRPVPSRASVPAPQPSAPQPSGPPVPSGPPPLQSAAGASSVASEPSNVPNEPSHPPGVVPSPAPSSQPVPLGQPASSVPSGGYPSAPDAPQPGYPSAPQPVASKPVAPQPVAPQPGHASAPPGDAAQPGYPSAPQPSAAQPSAAQPSAAQPSAAQPSAAQPSAAQPSAAQPSAAQPSAAQPSAAQPSAAQPSAAQPGYPSAPAVPAPPAPSAPTPEIQPVPEAPPEPELDPNSLEGLLSAAGEASREGRKPQAADAYRRVLEMDPTHAEALTWIEEFLRQRRKFGDLRDVLMAAAGESVPVDDRLSRMREAAEICEQKLRDHDNAIKCYHEILALDADDDETRANLEKLLEKQKRWDDLAPALETRAHQLDDVEAKVGYLERAAEVHEKWRRDPATAARTWRAIMAAKPGEEGPLDKALELYAEAKDDAATAETIAEAIAHVTDDARKGGLLERLGELRSKAGDHGGAGEAYAEAGALLDKPDCLDLAAEAYEKAERWSDLAAIKAQRAEDLEGEDKVAALAAAGHARLQAGEVDEGLQMLEQASELNPNDEDLATKIEEQYHQAQRHGDQVRFLLSRASRVADREMRVGLNHRAAAIQRSLGDEEGTRQSLQAVLEDGDDVTALRILLDMAERRQDWPDAVELLARLVGSAEPADKLAYAIREAQLLADGTGDIDQAIDRYQRILKEDDPENRYALGAMSDLEMRRNNHAGAAEALERLLELLDGEDKIEVARKLAQLYEGPLEDAEKAVAALDIVHAGDPTDLDAIARLQRMAEKREDWPRVASLLEQLIEVEGDEEEATEMTLKLSRLYADEVDDADKGLAALEKFADRGDARCQQAFVELGIRLERKGAVADKLMTWNASSAGTSRVDSLRRAFGLFLEADRDDRARDVALELARSKDCDAAMARDLEQVATRLRDLAGLSTAHELIAGPMNGVQRAEEYVRQAEVMVEAGADPLDAIYHGELGLGGLAGEEAMPLMHRLAALTQAPGHVVDLFERHVQRCKRPQERIAALAAAAQVAAERGALDRAKEFFDSALAGGIQQETLASLEAAAREADRVAGGDGRLLRAMAEALAAGGQGSRDGGRTRSALLRRAAAIAHEELKDTEAAFQWLGGSLIAHVDDKALEALERLGAEVGDMGRVEAGLSRALEEVYDGPLVRKLLRRRADLRRKTGSDLAGAASDLKRLHDLSPADDGLTKELSKLLIELGDHRGMIELYEDQILRGREAHVRAELARKVARIWEEEIGDARESADAWRRVLRMKAGDKEATAGLERAKAGKLKKPPPVRGKSMPPGTGTGAPPPSIPPASRSVPPSRPPGAGQPYAPKIAPPPSVPSSVAEIAPPAESAPPAEASPPAMVPHETPAVAPTSPEMVSAEAPVAADVVPPQMVSAEAPVTADVAPPGDVAPPAMVAPPGDVTPPDAVAPPAEVAPQGEAFVPDDVMPPGELAPPGEVSPSHAVNPAGEVSFPGEGRPSGELAPPGIVASPASVVPSEESAPQDGTAPTEVGPEGLLPTDAQPMEVQPEGLPQPVDAQPMEVQPEEVQPMEVQPEEVQPMEVQPEEVQPMEVQPEELQAMEARPQELQPMVQPEEAQPIADPAASNGQPAYAAGGDPYGQDPSAVAQSSYDTYGAPSSGYGQAGVAQGQVAAYEQPGAVAQPAYDPQLFQQYVDHYVSQGYTVDQAQQYAEYYLVPGAAEAAAVEEASEDAIELDAGDVEQLDDDDAQIEP